MEKSPTNSAVNGARASSSAEESGWTIYFEEFMALEEKRAAAADQGGFSSSSSVASGNSLISDAASCAAWKPVPAAGLEVSEKYRKLSLKRRKGKGGLLGDDPLEDTASSPVNSPKVTDLSNLTSNPRKKDIGRRETHPEEGAVGFRDGFDFAEGANQCTELKKKGLCLVPLSMLVDYI